MFENQIAWYEKHYKYFMTIALLVLIFSISILGYSKITTGEVLQKDISLKGGLLITVQTDKVLDIELISSQLEKELSTTVNVKSLKSLSSNAIVGYTIEIEKGVKFDQAKPAIEKIAGISLEAGGYTTEDVSSSLGQTFFQSMVKAMIVAFVLMSIVIFVYFRMPVPSIAIILAGLSNLLGTMAIMNLLGMRLSTGGIAALLMIIGYSVDTNVLLSTRVLKRREGTINERIRGSVKTGLTMQIAAIASMATLLIFTQAIILKQIASILIIGLSLDIINTWIQNAGILKWHLERKGEQ